jgi:superfamily II DNA/RNA helicase
LTGSVTSEEIQSRLQDIGSRKGIVVLATDAAIKGVELNLDVVIHYDLPSSFQRVHARFARFMRIGHSGVVRMIGLVERNAATSVMWDKLLRVANTLSDEGWK